MKSMATLTVNIDGKCFDVELESPLKPGDPVQVIVNGERSEVIFIGSEGVPDNTGIYLVNGKPYLVSLDNELKCLEVEGESFQVAIRERCKGDGLTPRLKESYKAPIPGTITQIFVSEGDTVSPGQPLIILEAMKMDNIIKASANGRVKRVLVSLGQNVSRDDLLVEICEEVL